MKKPSRKECPCCGVEFVTQSDAGGGPYTFEANVRPECVELAVDANGKMFARKLTWVCQICGCKFDHVRTQDGCKAEVL